MNGSEDSLQDMVSIPIVDVITISDETTSPRLTERKINGGSLDVQEKWDSQFDVHKEKKKVNWIQSIWEEKDYKHLFLFIILMFSVFTIEIFYGSYAGSLGLISAAFHALFHTISLVISLVTMILAKHKPTSKYSYGYDRFEILSGFTNSIFLVFVCLWILFEATNKLLDPTEMHSDHAEAAIFVAVLGLAVNIIGVIFFHEFKQTRSESRYEHLYGISVGIIMDASTQLVVIASTFISRWGFLLADPLVSFGIAIWLGYNVFPICNRTGKVLLQTTPSSIKDQLDKARREVQTLEGVLECTNEHFWTQSPGVFVGSLSVRVRSDANEQVVLAKTRSLLSPWVSHLTIQVEKDDWMLPLAT